LRLTAALVGRTSLAGVQPSAADRGVHIGPSPGTASVDVEAVLLLFSLELPRPALVAAGLLLMPKSITSH
jgi:hypothetical protein